MANNPDHVFVNIPISKKIKAEKRLLGALIREPFNISKVIERLNRVCLSNANDGLDKVFLEILDQFSSNGEYNSVTISEKTGSAKLAVLASQDTEIDLEWAVDYWWGEYSIWAELTAYSAASSLSMAGADALQMKEKLEETRNLLGLNSTYSKNTGKEDFAEWAVNKMDGKEPVYKTSIPIYALRKIIKAFKPGYMTIIAGRPAMGKTQYALNLLSGFCDNGAKGLFFSLEMTSEDIFRRLLGIRHGIDPESDWRGDDLQVLSRAVSEVASLDVEIIDNVFSMSEIEAICLASHYRGGIDYVFVDYIGLVKPSSDAMKRSQNRERDIASLSEGFVRLSKRLKCPVIILSQLNRAVETRGGAKRPALSDLRDSGSLEQDAANILFLYRPEYYEILENEKGESLKGIGEIIVAKQRNGRTDTAFCEFSPIRGYRDIRDDTQPTENNPSANFPRQEPDQDLPF